MEVYTDRPGIQFYSGNFISGNDKGKEGVTYVKRGGICLESQYFPNALNIKEFESPVIKAGEDAYSRTVYRFI